MSDSESDGCSNCCDFNMDLGFLEDSPRWKLESRYFPSKVGSKPAWLAFSEDIPCSKDLTCNNCNKPQVFLCQLYAPIIDKEEYCFHRTVFVFICKTIGCIKNNSNDGFRVFRCQLSRANKYYPFDPPVEEETWRSDLCAELFGIKLCNVCGIRSTNHCAGCKAVYYCCKEHQVFDWKSGHKQKCKESTKTVKLNDNKGHLFPEYEIVIEHENDISADDKCADENDDLSLSQRKGTLQGVDCDEELGKMALSEEDKNFVKFRNRTKCAPDQIIRYDLGGLPLWVSDNNIPSIETNVPDCEYCGERRIFEFQIMPQLLNHLGLEESQNSLDWGTLVVFTCKNSCNDGPDYKEECLLKQDMFNGAETL